MMDGDAVVSTGEGGGDGVSDGMACVKQPNDRMTFWVTATQLTIATTSRRVRWGC